MKILQTEITSSLNSHISLVERDETHFKSPFHYHPELELVYVKESYGKRIIGDKIEPFEAGDMVFIGSNLPHVWLNDEIFYNGFTKLKAKSIVLYFNKDVLGPAFYNLEETGRVTAFFQKAARGIRIEGKTKTTISQKLEKMLPKKGFEKILSLFEILHILSQSKDISFITTEGYSPKINNTEADRLGEVYKFVQQNFKEDISLKTVAGIASLTPQSFCRLFKKRTNKHFVEYLNEIRISHACRYLLDTDWSISEIAYACGYKTVSNFNKLFREMVGSSPKIYRENASNV